MSERNKDRNPESTAVLRAEHRLEALSGWLIHLAVRWAPPELSERLEEE